MNIVVDPSPVKLSIVLSSISKLGAVSPMNVPNTFNIHYMYFDRQNQYLDPISECVLTDFSVSYGGDGRFKTFDADDSGSPPPVETSIQMTFKELELITRERVEEGRALGGQIGFGPLNPVNS